MSWAELVSAEAGLLFICLGLAVLVLIRQAGLLRGESPRDGKSAAAHQRSPHAANNSIRQQFGASLRESSIAASLGVSRAGRAGFASPMGVGRVSQRAPTSAEPPVFSPLRATRGMALENNEVERRFVDLLKAITYLEDVEHSAFGFSVSSKRRPGPDDFPWIDTVMPHGPAASKLQPHERIVRINSESTREWPAEKVKRAVLASPIRLNLSVITEGNGASRQEVLYRGRLGRVHVLCERCSHGEQCDTSRALLHFKELMEHAHSIGDLREMMTKRTHDALCPPKEKEVFTKILAFALACSDSGEPPGGPARSPTGKTIHNLSLSADSYKPGSALSMSMLDLHADSEARTPKGFAKVESASPGSSLHAAPADAQNRKLLNDAEAIQVCLPRPRTRRKKISVGDPVSE